MVPIMTPISSMVLRGELGDGVVSDVVGGGMSVAGLILVIQTVLGSNSTLWSTVTVDVNS